MSRLILFVLLVVLPRQVAAGDASSEIKQAFGAYKAALLAGDGAAAAGVVDADTLAYYGKMKRLALTAPAAVVKRQPIMDRLMIVVLRHRVAVKDLRAMSPRKMIEHGVEQGWIGKESMADIELGKITVRGERATGQMVRGGKPMPVEFAFRREAGSWRLNLQALMDVGGSALSQVARAQKISEDQLIVSLVESVSGRPVPATIWNPPR
jgi:hypothetical protein